MRTEERRLAVLRAIVEGYVETKEPVGSKVLATRHHLGVSPATIRNDMAALEEAGLIAQPHTSAGRIPTDAGYRMFVDRLTNLRPLSSAEQRAITTLLTDTRDLDDLVERTVRLLAQLTHQVAMVRYPSLSSATVRHVELVRVSETRLLVVVITTTGQVEQRLVMLHSPVTEELLGELRARLNDVAVGQQIRRIPTRLDRVAAAMRPEDRELAAQVVHAVAEALAVNREDRVMLAGTANLVRSGEDFHVTSLSEVLEAIEEQVVMLRLLEEMADDPAVGLTVRIGRENELVGLHDAAVVTTGYGQGELSARLGVLGPTRMDYPTTMAAVRAVARYVSRIVATKE